MAQVPYRANLSTTVFPMLLAKAGRTVINPQYDQDHVSKGNVTGNRNDSIPQAIFMENILPTAQGFQSVGYEEYPDISVNESFINAVIPIKLATITNTVVPVEDVDITDTGDTIEDWTVTTFFNSRLGNPHDTAVYPSLGESDDGSFEGPIDGTLYREVAESTVEGSASVNSYRLSSLIGNEAVALAGDDPDGLDICAVKLLRSENIANSDLIELSYRVRFKSGTLYHMVTATPEVADFRKFMNVVVANTTALLGLRITFNSVTGNLAICSCTGPGLTNYTPTPLFSIPLTVAYDTWYIFEVTVVLNEDNTREVTVVAKTDADVVITTLSGIISASVAVGEVIGFIHHSHTVLDVAFLDVPDATEYAIAPDKIYYDSITIQANVIDESFTINSGVTTAYLAFMTDHELKPSYSISNWSDQAVDVGVGYESPEAEDRVSTATVRGICYLCIRRNDDTVKIYIVSVVADVFTLTDITAEINEDLIDGYSVNDVVSIAGSYNYLILVTPGRVFWSSTITPSDFEASLVTGAGSDVPNNIAGDIKFAKEHVAGFFLYTAQNVVFAAYTGNARYPWKFREVAGSGGYLKSTQVSGDTNTPSQLGITKSKIIQSLSPDSCELIGPEISEYLERSNTVDIFDFDALTNNFTVQYINDLAFSPGGHKIWYLLDRYIFVAQYQSDSDGPLLYERCIVFDNLLKRYGRLKVRFNTVITDESKIFFIQYNTGEIRSLIFDIYANVETFDATLVLGKFQFSRNNFIQMEEIEIESSQDPEFLSPMEGGPLDGELPYEFLVRLLPSIDGKTFLPMVAPTEIATSTKILRQFRCHTTARNFCLLIRGKFDISTLQLIFNVHGRY